MKEFSSNAQLNIVNGRIRITHTIDPGRVRDEGGHTYIYKGVAQLLFWHAVMVKDALFSDQA